MFAKKKPRVREKKGGNKKSWKGLIDLCCCSILDRNEGRKKNRDIRGKKFALTEQAGGENRWINARIIYDEI